jgi:hydroxymethylglutaryl-CoA lyase
MRLDVSTAFDCPFTGRLPEVAVFSLLDRALERFDDLEIALCDTTGRGTPDHVRMLFEGCLERYRGRGLTWAFHAHDTYGMAIANVLMAYAAGIRTFDASVGGLGGCPFAPGATGNVASEDVVYLFERMGIATGIDLATLLPIADEVAEIPGAVAGGHLRGVPRERLLQDETGTNPSEG